jgi:hypothetical protein
MGNENLSVEGFYSLAFDGTLDEVFGGALDYVPDVRIGFQVLEPNVAYHVRVKLGDRGYPDKRKRGSAIALYASLYALPNSDELYIKLGSHSLYYTTVGSIWAQAPLYTKIVGVFIINKEVHTEYVEEECRRFLIREFKRTRKEKIKGEVIVGTRVPQTKKIISMWMHVKEVEKDLEERMSMVDDVVEKCYNYLSRNASKLSLETLYGSDMWFRPPLYQLDIGGGYVAGIREFVRQIQGSGRAVDAELMITPMGLCILRAPIKNLSSNITTYIDSCRALSYYLQFSL